MAIFEGGQKKMAKNPKMSKKQKV